MSVTTSEETIPPIPLNGVGSELERWAAEARVESRPVEGVWWRRAGTEDLSLQDQAKKGLIALQFHGGGYMLGSAKEVQSGFSRIPRGLVQHGICASVLSLEYSLVGFSEEDPSRPFPQQILEALSAYQHVVNTLNVPPSRVILVGDSAGGHLALALQRYLSETQSLPSPAGIILLSPWCDLAADSERPQMPRLLGPMSKDYLSSPYFSPSLHPFPKKWPPTLVYYGASESFVPSITTLTDRLKDAGVPVTSHAAIEEIPVHMSHDFLIMVNVDNGWPDEVRKCWKRIKSWTDTLGAK